MRNLPIKRNQKHNEAITAVWDFFGGYKISKRKKIDIALWIMNRRKGIKLDEEQQEALWYIKSNLTDQIYRQNLNRNPISAKRKAKLSLEPKYNSPK